MRRTAALATSAFLAGAVLTVPADAMAGRADPAVGEPATARQSPTLRLKRSAASFHTGMPGVKITAVARTKGRVTFRFAGKRLTRKLKRGKASFRLRSDLAPGVYRIRASVPGRQPARTRVRVHDSSLSVSGTRFSISAAGANACQHADPVLSGTVLFKGAHPDTGYVDFFVNGNIDSGYSSPDYAAMTTIEEGGRFAMTCSLWNKARELGIGTHRFRAVYTPTSSEDGYIHSDWIVATVGP